METRDRIDLNDRLSNRYSSLGGKKKRKKKEKKNLMMAFCSQPRDYPYISTSKMLDVYVFYYVNCK